MEREHLSLPFILKPTKPGATIVGCRIQSDCCSDGTPRPVPYTVAIVWEGQGAKRKRQHRATAEFIVHACNCHYELLAELKSLVDQCRIVENADLKTSVTFDLRYAQAAITKACPEIENKPQQPTCDPHGHCEVCYGTWFVRADNFSTREKRCEACFDHPGFTCPGGKTYIHECDDEDGTIETRCQKCGKAVEPIDAKATQ